MKKNVIGVIQLEFSFMQENEKTFECLELEISFHLHAIIICIMAVLNVLVLQCVSSEICNPLKKVVLLIEDYSFLHFSGVC